MPPSPGTPFWILHDKRVIPRRSRRLLREQDEAIIAERLMYQVNAVPGRPIQTPKGIMYILRSLRGTIDLEGKTQMKKCWNISNLRDTTIRAFWYNLLMGFFPTLERQRWWYPEVDNHQELAECAKCNHPFETPEHIDECADHSQVELCFRDRPRALQPLTTHPDGPPGAPAMEMVGMGCKGASTHPGRLQSRCSSMAEEGLFGPLHKSSCNSSTPPSPCGMLPSG